MKFAERVTAFMQQYHYTPSQFGRAAMGDPNFVPRLLKGRQVTERIMDKVDQWMARPSHVDRAIVKLLTAEFPVDAPKEPKEIAQHLGVPVKKVLTVRARLRAADKLPMPSPEA